MDSYADSLISKFRGKRIAIVGDLVADQFLSGTISRVSREAPVFILRHDDTVTSPGGAANAAANIASLGGTPLLIGIIGNDPNGSELRKALESSNVSCEHFAVGTEPQTTKVRVLAGQHYAAKQQVIRIDYEPRKDVDTEIRRTLCSALESAAETADAIVISDYNYGVVDKEIYDLALSISKRRLIPLIVDSRFRLAEFPGATSATPNQDEVEQILGPDFKDTDCVGLMERFGLGSLLITRGNQGMLLIEPGKPPFAIEAVGSTTPVDVTGAGDTVIAVYSLGLASGLSFAEAAMIANHAGGIVVMKKGTAVVNVEELSNSLETNAPRSTPSAA